MDDGQVEAKNRRAKLSAGLGCIEPAYHLDLVIIEARYVKCLRYGATNLEAEPFVRGNRRVVAGSHGESNLPEAGHGFSKPHSVTHQSLADSLPSCRWLHVHASDEAAVTLFQAGFTADGDDTNKGVVDECTEYMPS
jgi:hypothetical protein